MTTLLQPSNLSVYALQVNDDLTWAVTPGFAGHANVPGNKIYMLCSAVQDMTIYYIGQTSRTMKARFDAGFASSRSPYRWSQRAGRYRLLVWDLRVPCPDRTLLEAVEAELVLAARISQIGWPQLQTGISFRHIIDGDGWQSAPRLAIEMMGQFYDHLSSVFGAGNNMHVASNRQRVLDMMKDLILPGS